MRPRAQPQAAPTGSELPFVFIGDGADWIWRRVGDLDNERGRHILDFCHAADHLAAVCRSLMGRAHERLQRWRTTLRDGGASELMVELKQLRNVRSGQRPPALYRLNRILTGQRLYLFVAYLDTP